MHRVPFAAALVAGLAGCGATSSAGDRLTVYAASSLRDTMLAFDRGPTYDFAGSNQLQLRIERGAPADVFLAASPQEARALVAEGRCGRPLTFATNRIVLVVPRDGGRVASLDDLRAGGRRLAVGNAEVPIGDYTRRLLRRLGARGVLADNTVSSEANVSGIVAKVGLGSADAGFVYATDARAARDRLRAIELPRDARPRIEYAGCVVRRAGGRPGAASEFLRRLTGPRGRRTLQQLGFGLP